MRPNALDRKLLRDLWHMRGQVLTVALIVASGIATYVTMRGAYESIEQAQQEYYTRYHFADVFAQLKRAPNNLATDIASIPGVSAVETRLVVEVNLDVPGLNEPAIGRLISVPEEHAPMLNDLFIRRGRTIEPGRHDEVLVSEAFANANQIDAGSTIGAVINGRWEQLRVVGIVISPEYVYEIRGTEIFPDNKRFGVLWMSRKALGPLFDMEGGFNDVALTLTPGASEPGVIERLDKLLEPYGGLGAYGREDQLSNRFLTDEIAQDRITGIFVPTIFLGIAAFLIHVVLSRLVSTQRSPIGLLKAFGYSDAVVGMHYLKFALVAVLAGTAIGSPLGIWLGKGLAHMYQNFFRFPSLNFVAGPKLILWGVAISGAAACLGATSSLRGVVALPPAEAMRPESPPQFRQGIAERMGLAQLFSTSARMILRNLERRPWKAIFSVIGLSFAVAILIIGFYFFDAVDYLVQVQFHAAQRDDVTIAFAEPHGEQARYDVNHLTGVLESEPFRVVPARLRFKHRSKRIGLQGLESGGELRRVVGKNLDVAKIPPDGLLLTTKLAEILGVRPGDTVTVEVLEADRPVRQATVSGTVDEMIGLSAYMDISALNRMMREGRSISGAFLAVDAEKLPTLYSQLKRTPAVAGVAVRTAMLASFYGTIAESLRISTTALNLFACVIAIGMVYNGARVALSERGHELASLRVLGFNQREISFMLLGEQAFLVVAAIPLGFLTGYGFCALLTATMQTELYRMPLVISAKTYLIAVFITGLAAIATGALLYRRLSHLDLVAVLKTRE
ncbi:MAG TPA: FtsX-like permease family protein [Candidatus Acidoferrales bacterium]|nr:FtsX-like permease family protein [Candidatus Acidoferrales bacterium]